MTLLYPTAYNQLTDSIAICAQTGIKLIEALVLNLSRMTISTATSLPPTTHAAMAATSTTCLTLTTSASGTFHSASEPPAHLLTATSATSSSTTGNVSLRIRFVSFMTLPKWCVLCARRATLSMLLVDSARRESPA